jgi:hypothetical protein
MKLIRKGWDPDIAEKMAEFTDSENSWVMSATTLWALLKTLVQKFKAWISTFTTKAPAAPSVLMRGVSMASLDSSSEEDSLIGYDMDSLSVLSLLGDLIDLADDRSLVGRARNKIYKGINQAKAKFANLGFYKNLLKDKPRTKELVEKTTKLLLKIAKWVLTAIAEEKIKRIGKAVAAIFVIVETTIRTVKAIVGSFSEPDQKASVATQALREAGEIILASMAHIALAAMPLPVAVVLHTAWNAAGDIYAYGAYIKRMKREEVWVAPTTSSFIPPVVVGKAPNLRVVQPKDLYDELTLEHNGVKITDKDEYERIAREFQEASTIGQFTNGRGSLLLVDHESVRTMSKPNVGPASFLTAFGQRVHMRLPMSVTGVGPILGLSALLQLRTAPHPREDPNLWNQAEAYILEGMFPNGQQGFAPLVMTLKEEYEENANHTGLKRANYDEATRIHSLYGIEGFTEDELKSKECLKGNETLRVREVEYEFNVTLMLPEPVAARSVLEFEDPGPGVAVEWTGNDDLCVGHASDNPRSRWESWIKGRIFSAAKPALTITVRRYLSGMEKAVFMAISEGLWFLSEDGLVPAGRDSLFMGLLHGLPLSQVNQPTAVANYHRFRPHVIPVRLKMLKVKSLLNCEEDINEAYWGPYGMTVLNSCDDSLWIMVYGDHGGKKEVRLAGSDLGCCDLSMKWEAQDMAHHVYETVMPAPELAQVIEVLEDFHSGKRKAKWKDKRTGATMKIKYEIPNAPGSICTKSGARDTVIVGAIPAGGAILNSLNRVGLTYLTPERLEDLHSGVPGQFFEALIEAAEDVHTQMGLLLEWEEKAFTEYHTSTYLSCSIVETLEDGLRMFPTDLTKFLLIKTDPMVYFPGTGPVEARCKAFAGMTQNPLLTITPEGRALKRFLEKQSGPWLKRATEYWAQLRKNLGYEANPIMSQVVGPPLEMEDMDLYFQNMVADGLYPSDVGRSYHDWVFQLPHMRLGEVSDNLYVRCAREHHYGKIAVGAVT